MPQAIIFVDEDTEVPETVNNRKRARVQIYTSEALRIHKVGGAGGEAYLLCTKEHALLYDSGFAYSAPALVREIAALLEGREQGGQLRGKRRVGKQGTGEQEACVRELNYLFYTHSHYDHVSGGPWVKQRWPEVVVLGSAHTARVLERPSARATMQALNDSATCEAGALGRDTAGYDAAKSKELLNTLAVEVVVEEGTAIDMGDITLEVLAAPGHTRCSLMLWCPEERLLLGSESLGVQGGAGKVVPVCLTGYYDSVNTISKAEALKPEHILVSHGQVLSGAEAGRYLNSARCWSERTAALVWGLADEDKSRDEIAAALKELLFDEETRQYQPEAAFDLNNGYMIDQLLLCRK